MSEFQVGEYVLVNANGPENLRGKVFTVAKQHHCQPHRVILAIPAYGYGAGVVDVCHLERVSAERAAALFRSSLIPQSEAVRQEPLATQLALVIYNIAKSHNIQMAERIMEQNIHLFVK